MFLRATTRKKDGKEHRYWSVVENRRVAGARVVQRHVLYLGEINSSQELAWRLAIRPIFHQDQSRIEAHVFVAFLAYCLYVTLGRQLKGLASGLTARSALEKFAAMQMVDVRIPTTDGRELLLTRYTQPEPELELLLERLRLTLPAQPPPKISVAQTTSPTLL
jgi:hypothetical protein